MSKVVNPLVTRNDRTDAAYNCDCYCNVQEDNYDKGQSWTWLPWNSCGCACGSGNTENHTANHNVVA